MVHLNYTSEQKSAVSHLAQHPLPDHQPKLKRLISATLSTLPCAATLLLNGCLLTQPLPKIDISAKSTDTPYTGYVAINPISLPSDLFEPSTATSPRSAARGSEHDQDLDKLVNSTTRITIQELTRDGEINYLTSGFSTEGRFYQTTIDYIKYYSTCAPLLFPKNRDSEAELTVIGLAIGVGIRAEIRFSATKTGANISDAISIGAAARSGAISGTMSFQTMGIESKAISDWLPMPTELSSSTIQSALQTIATMKANIYSNTSVVPQIVGIDIQTIPKGHDVSDMLQVLQAQKSEVAKAIREEFHSQNIKFSSPSSSQVEVTENIP